MPYESRRVRSALLLRELRLSKGLSLRDAADRLPCSKSAIHALEDGKMQTLTSDLAHRIAEVYGVEVGVLFDPAPSIKRGRPASDPGQVAA